MHNSLHIVTVPWLYNLYNKIEGKLWILQLLAQWEIYSQWIFADSILTFIFHERSFWQSCFAKIFLESKLQKDPKHRQKEGKKSKHSLKSTCWIQPALLLCCFVQTSISGCSEDLCFQRKSEQNQTSMWAHRSAVIQDSKSRTASAHRAAESSPALTASEHSPEKSQPVGLGFDFILFFIPLQFSSSSHSSEVWQSLKALEALLIYFYKSCNKSV